MLQVDIEGGRPVGGKVTAGMPLEEFEQVLVEADRTNKDFVVSGGLRVGHDGNGLNLELNGSSYGLSQTFIEQLASRIGAPKSFVEKTQGFSELAPLVNKLIGDDDAMIRTNKDTARALLSAKYRRIDNLPVAKTVLAALQQSGRKFSVRAANVSPDKLHIKFVFPEIRSEVGVGDVVESGIMVSNSEVGRGSFSVVPFIHRLACLNGMVVNQSKLGRRHTGSNLISNEGTFELFESDTMKAANDALMLQMRDLVLKSATEVGFESIVQRMREAQGMKIAGDPVKAVQNVIGITQMPKSAEGFLLRELAEGGLGFNKYGMVNAITAYAHEVSSFDDSVEFERIGGDVLDWTHAAWDRATSVN